MRKVVPAGAAVEEAVRIAEELSRFPQTALREDRLSVLEQWDLDGPAAVENELRHGWNTLASGEPAAGSARFAGGQGRAGAFDNRPPEPHAAQ